MSKRVEWKSIDVLSAGKIYGVLLALMGLLFAVAGLIAGSAFVSLFGLRGLFGFGTMVVVLPLLYGLFGFLTGVMIAVFYNLAARLVGGVIVETKGVKK